MRLTAIEFGFGWGEASQTPQITLHTGQYVTLETQRVTTQFAIKLLRGKWPELGAYLFVGNVLGGNSNGLEKKLFSVRAQELAASLNAKIVFEDVDLDARAGLALLAINHASASEGSLWSGYSRLFMSQGIDDHLQGWRREQPSIARLVELGAIVIDDDHDRDLLVLNLLCSADRASDIGSLFHPFVDPTDLIAPLLDSSDIH